MRRSAGIIPFRIDESTGEMEFFLGHPGGYGWSNKNYWAYLKGHVEDDESEDETAIREFKEESGLTMENCTSQMLIPLGQVIQNSNKIAIAYGLHYPNIDPDECKSNVIEDGITPEIDSYKWIKFSEIPKVTHKTHLVFYEQLNNMFNMTYDD